MTFIFNILRFINFVENSEIESIILIQAFGPIDLNKNISERFGFEINSISSFPNLF